jgi:hypothetical protein
VVTQIIGDRCDVSACEDDLRLAAAAVAVSFDDGDVGTEFFLFGVVGDAEFGGGGAAAEAT